MKLAKALTLWFLRHDVPEQRPARAADMGAVGRDLWGRMAWRWEFVQASGQTKALITLQNHRTSGQYQRTTFWPSETA